MHKAIRIIFLTLFIVSAQLACSSGEVKISDGYIPVRSQTQQHFAAYFNIENNTVHSVQLVSASSPQFNDVSLHETRIENGLSKMRPLEGLLIEANSSGKLEPNAKHLMLMQPTAPIWELENIELRLHFSDESEMTALIPLHKKQQ